VAYCTIVDPARIFLVRPDTRPSESLPGPGKILVVADLREFVAGLRTCLLTVPSEWWFPGRERLTNAR